MENVTLLRTLALKLRGAGALQLQAHSPRVRIDYYYYDRLAAIDVRNDDENDGVVLYDDNDNDECFGSASSGDLRDE